MSDTSKTNCCATVRSGSDYWRNRYKPCSRAGIVDRNGELYCSQHDPDAIVERRQKTSDRWAAESAERGRQNRMLAAAPDLLAAAVALLSDIRSRYPGEALRCPHMIALDAAVNKATGAQNV